ncbi:MAG: hypothetical protein ACXWJK_05510, partial [Burkholderiaceae bacterium]
RVVFRVGSTDAKQLAEGFAYFERDDIESLGRGQAIVRIGGASNDCNLSTILVQPLPAEEAKARTAAIIAQSRARFAMPLAELKEQFAEWYPQKEEPTPLPTPPTTKAPPTQEAPSKKIEIPQQPKTKRPEPPELPELGRGGAEHKYLQHLIKRLAEERGFRAMIEEAAGDGRADIVLKKDKLTIACEISVTTTVEHEVANLTKCLQSKPKFNHLIFICKDKRRRDKVQKLLASTQPEAANIIYISPEEIVTAIECIDPSQIAIEGMVRGYKVKVSQQNLSASDIAARRAAVAEVIAKSLSKG